MHRGQIRHFWIFVFSSWDVYYSGQVFISDFEVNAADKDDVKFTATFVVTLPPLTQTETA